LGLLIVFLIVLDQWSKDVVQSSFYLGESLHLIPGFFSLTYVHNPGAAWGMGADADNWLRYLMFRYVPVLVCGGWSI
jgi:signal peptidase II